MCTIFACILRLIEHRKNVPHYTSNDLTRLVWMLCLLNWISLTPPLLLRCCRCRCCFSCCCSDAKRIVCFHIWDSSIIVLCAVWHSVCCVLCTVYNAMLCRCACTTVSMCGAVFFCCQLFGFCYFTLAFSLSRSSSLSIFPSVSYVYFVCVCVFLSFGFRAHSVRTPKHTHQRASNTIFLFEHCANIILTMSINRIAVPCTA